jgi:leader peptidase (prepilin peptidase)/N-methyltransferase
MTEPAIWLAYFGVVVTLLGLLVGSFLNVVIYRVPNGMSVVSPPSACPSCGSAIKPYDNIPVISWIVLRGRCRNCRSRISARYIVVEAATAVFFALVALKFLPPTLVGSGSTLSAIGSTLVLIAFLYLAAVSVALALIDIDTHKLPNRIVLPSYIVGIVLLSIGGLLASDYRALLGAGIGAAALFAFYLALALAYPRGMGFGDVKLAGVLGLYLGYLGWGSLLSGAFAAFLFGGIFSIALVMIRKAGRKTGIPFGPWMLAGAWVGVFFGEVIAHDYLALFGIN